MARDEGRATPPPADLNTRNLHLAKFSFADWRRIHLAPYGACFYSPNPTNRFSSPGCPVLYVGDKVVTTFWETFWDDLETVPEDRRILPENKLKERRLCAVMSHREFLVFNSTNAKALRAVSANAAAFDADYAICQAWAVALLNHPQKPEGILYSSVRHNGGVCLGLFACRTDCPEMDFRDMGVLDAAPTVRALITKEHIGLL